MKLSLRPLWVVVVLCAALGSTQAQNSITYRQPPFMADSIWQMPVTTLDGKPFSLSKLQNKKAAVILFMFPDCPIATKSSAQLRQLIADFRPQGVEFYAVFPNKYIHVDSILSYEREFQVHMAFLLDRDLHLTRYLGARVVPHAFVVTPDARVHYSGQIDNMFYALSRRRQVITEHYLRDALTAVLAGQPVKKTFSEPIGCFIYATAQEEKGKR